MFNKFKSIYLILLLVFNFSYSMDIQDLECNSILNFVELDENEDQIKFKKKSISFFQDLLDNKKDNSFLTKGNILALLGFGAIAINFFFVFKMFDLSNKNLEDIKSLEKENKDLKDHTEEILKQMSNEIELLKKENINHKKILTFAIHNLEKASKEAIKEIFEKNGERIKEIFKKNDENIKKIEKNVVNIVQKKMEANAKVYAKAQDDFRDSIQNAIDSILHKK